LKEAADGLWRISNGNEFQIFGAQKEKERSPNDAVFRFRWKDLSERLSDPERFPLLPQEYGVRSPEM
jgi:hypothetical protein